MIPVLGFAQSVEKSTANSEIKTVEKVEKKTTKHPLYIVDGKEIPYDEVEKIDPNEIESINVYKNMELIREKFGEKGENGVVEIILKVEEEKQWR